MSKTIELNDYLSPRFKREWKPHEVVNNNPNADAIYKIDGTTLTLFKSGKLLIQGKEEEEILKKLYMTTMKTSIDTIGSDEVGVGDFFGPMVACAAYVSKYDSYKLKQMGVGDSKTLTDDRMRVMAEEIKKVVKWRVVGASNKMYNMLTSSGVNSHAIKAWLHNKAITELMERCSPDMIIVDQFVEAKHYFRYLKEIKSKFPKIATQEVFEKIHFQPKAESHYIAVAAGSIIARAEWLKAMDKMAAECGGKVPFGTNDIVKAFARRMIKEKGLEWFTNNVKRHFKTYDELVG